MTFRSLALVLVSVALLGCNVEKTRNLIDQRSDEVAQGLQDAKQQQQSPKKSYDPLTVSDKVWAGGTSMRLRRGMPLPDKLEGRRGVTVVSDTPMSLADIANTIGAQTAVPVRVASGAADGGSNGTPAAGAMPLSYEGPLSGLLDQVAGFYGINWRYDGSSINFSRYETRVFVIEALPGSQTVKDGMKEAQANTTTSSSGGVSLSGNASSTNSLTQSSEMNVEIKVWDELTQTVSSMLGGVGTVVSAPSSGTMTVTTTPELMRPVAQFVEQENKRLSRQIGINVEIYKVELTEGSNFGFNFNDVMMKVGNFKSAFSGIDGAPTSITGGGQLGVAILNPGQNPRVSGLFEALSTLGDATRVAQFPMTTLNNRPVSRRVGQDTSYVASLSSITTANVGTQTTITPGVIPEGFSLQLTPRLLDDGRIMMQYSLNIIDVVELKTFASDGTTSSSSGATTGLVQLPVTANRVFVQQSLLKSGATLIIGGYDDEKATQSSRGVGHPLNFLLGGGQNSSTTRSMLFMAITPQVLDVPRAEQI
ncbi:MAG: hypothetical protein HGA90_00080 [Alphaproteobacteria bacterium]|nr:hypothetical protein [Alphaproteobacteria bacterium]